MVRVAIVGASGYTGVELIRLLRRHPSVKIGAVTSRGQDGEPVDRQFPSLSGCGLHFVDPAKVNWAEHQVVFFATPHATSMHLAREILGSGCRVIDLSADFRLRDRAEFERWYGVEHAAPELLSTAVYGLPELFGAELAEAQLVACAGCYPTAVQLACAPALAAGVVSPQGIIADCKSGVTGAGRAAKVSSLYSECADSFSAYASAGHRHQPEIAQGLSRVAGEAAELLFQPHLVPMLRGIHATVYLKKTAVTADWQQLYSDYYARHRFVRVREPGAHPATRDVRASNSAHLAVVDRGDTLMVLSVIDNLVKGASGQAVQCLNGMYGWPQETALDEYGTSP